MGLEEENHSVDGTFEGSGSNQKSQNDNVWKQGQEIRRLAGALDSLGDDRKDGDPREQETQRKLQTWSACKTEVVSNRRWEFVKADLPIVSEIS